MPKTNRFQQRKEEYLKLDRRAFGKIGARAVLLSRDDDAASGRTAS